MRGGIGRNLASLYGYGETATGAFLVSEGKLGRVFMFFDMWRKLDGWNGRCGLFHFLR